MKPSEFRRLMLFAATVLTAGLVAVAAPAAQQSAKTLTVGTMWEALPLSMEPRRSRFFNESEILDTLVKLDYDMRLKPGLAVAWERESPTQWLFTLREGVVFHDGSPLDAEAVKNSLERVLDLLPYARSLLNIASMEAVAPLKLRIVTAEPYSALPNQLTDAFTGIYGKDSFNEAGEFVRPVGTGPYKLVEYRPEDRTVVERFEDYWGEAPEIGRIVYRYIPDHTTRALSLEAGEVDFVDNLPPAEVRRLQKLEQIQVFAEPTAGLYYLVLKTDAGPFADPLVRRALDRLIDRDAIVEYGLEGVGLPATSFFSPALDGFPAEPLHGYDPEAASELLRQAGYQLEQGRWTKDDAPLSLELLSYASRTEMPLIREAAGQLLRQAGIDVSLELYDWAGMLDLVKQGDYDGYLVFWTPEMIGHPDLHLSPHFHSANNLDGNGYANPELDRLIEKGRQLDPGPERDAIYAEAMRLIAEDTPVVPLVHKVFVAAASDAIVGYRVHPSGFFYDFKSVSLR